MSDVSILSHEYQDLSTLAEGLNRALLLLKRTREPQPVVGAIDPAEVQRARTWLAERVDDLVGLLDPNVAPTERGDVAGRLPAGLVARLREEHGDLQWYLADLRSAAEALRKGEGLSDQQLMALDEFALTAQEEVTSVFRRMMRA